MLFVGLSIFNIFCIIVLGVILRSVEILRFGIFGGIFLLMYCPLCLLGIYISAKEAEDHGNILALLVAIFAYIPLMLYGLYTVIKYNTFPVPQLISVTLIPIFLRKILSQIKKHRKSLEPSRRAPYYQIDKSLIESIKNETNSR